MGYYNWTKAEHDLIVDRLIEAEKNIDKLSAIINKIETKQLDLYGVVKSLPSKEELDNEVKTSLVDWGYNEHSSKKIFERGFKSCFYWFKNKPTK